MADRELVVKFDGKDVGLDKASKNAEQSIGGVAKGTAAGVLSAAALTDGLSTLASGLSDCVKAAGEDQAQQTQLANQLKNVTGATDEQVASVESWINKTQNSTGILDDHLRPALQNLVVSTKDVGEAQKLMGTAMDISKAKGLDLETVSAAMAKAHDGNTGALQKLGIATKDAGGNALSFDQIMQNANATFGGATAAAADTAQGKMAILGAKFSDIQENVGNALIPILTNLGSFISDKLVPAFTDIWNWLGKVGAFVNENKEYFIAMGVGIMAMLVPALIAWAISAASAAAATIAAAAPVVIITAAIAALAAGVVYAYTHWGWFKKAVDGVKDALLWVWDNVFKPVASFISDEMVPAIAGVIDKITEWAGYAKEGAKTIIDDVGKVLTWFEDLPGKIGSAISRLADIITSPFRSAFNSVADFWNGTVGSLSFTLPDWIPGIGGKGFSMPKLPHLADGGIVTGPTVALIGEAGPEAVVPLSKMSGMGGGMTVNVYMPQGSNGADVVAAIQRYERIAGKGWRT